MDQHTYRRSAREQTEDTPLFAPMPEPEGEAPSARGSASSERGAKAIDPHRKGQNYLIMLTLITLERGRCLSREEISERTKIKESSACGRLDDLKKGGWVEQVSDACKASSGVTVNGYRLTASGREFMQSRRGAA